MDLTVRDAAAADAEAVAGLLEQLGYPTTARQAERRLQVLGGSADWRVLAAVDPGGVVVGLVAAEVIPLLEHDDPVCRLAALVVDDAHRGRGIGAVMVRAVEELARERGCHGVMLTTARHRAGAHAFYRRLGYVDTGLRFVKMLD
ncbi:MAG TPA: GNAT family N-acetyltransferase [Thermomicrobiaceae bacterium]|nr:GNAT family N-acetyltransferase [Thermomicrobiaceae bacterium]